MIRDDKEPFLFDVSTVPHMHLHFADEGAKATLSDELVARMKEVDHLRDARLAVAAASLTANERTLLGAFSKYGMDRIFFSRESNLAVDDTMSRLLDKQLVRSAGISDTGKGMFRWTALGKVLASDLDRLLPVIKVPPKPEVAALPNSPDESSAT